MESLNLFQCDLCDSTWHYKGEGNANLVIALEAERKVLRIHKEDNDKMQTESGTDIITSILYYEKIILPLFTNSYFQIPMLGKIDEKQVQILIEKLDKVRPESRKNKTIKPGYVTVFQDLTLLPYNLSKSLEREDVTSRENPVFCIEIKPKQGWYASSDRKFTKCSFCLNQYLKLSEKSISNPSTYCPLDLFSGNKTRMLKSIQSLLHNPQNNIRIFRNGTLVLGDTAPMKLNDLLEMMQLKGNNPIPDIENLSTLVLNMLTQNITENNEDDFPNNLSLTQNCAEIVTQNCAEIHNHALLNQYESTSQSNNTLSTLSRIPVDLTTKLNSLLLLKTQPCDFSSEPLPLNSILDKILKIQQLDTYGADYVYHYFKASQEAVDTTNPKYDSAHFINDEFPRVLDPIECYLLSTMAKDCSVMISFQRLHTVLTDTTMFPIAEDLSGNKYIFSVNVADVDAKPVHCIEKHYKRDNKIVQAALNILEEKD